MIRSSILHIIVHTVHRDVWKRVKKVNSAQNKGRLASGFEKYRIRKQCSGRIPNSVLLAVE